MCKGIDSVRMFLDVRASYVRAYLCLPRYAHSVVYQIGISLPNLDLETI